MDEVGMDPSIFLVPWFICLFSKGFINSVSAYIINFLLLESRHYRIGYSLLRVALAIMAAILNREEPFTCQKDFSKIFFIKSHSSKC
jgi:hypothetical protein